MNDFFAYGSLEKYLSTLKEMGDISSFANSNAETKFILRHDVDFDIIPAYKLAELEKKWGVTSTFFIRISSETYNACSVTSRVMIRNMEAMGFEMGLHFDPSIYQSDNVQDAFRFELAMLSALAGKKIKSISLHNPSISGQYPMFEGYYNAYDKSKWNDDNYISDSCMDFRGKDIYDFVINAPKPVQIVLHPFHYAGILETYIEKIKRYVIFRLLKIDEIYQKNPTYVKDMGGKKLLDILLEREAIL